MVKVRIQLKSEARGANLSPIFTAKKIYKEGGFTNFYKGYKYIFCFNYDFQD